MLLVVSLLAVGFSLGKLPLGHAGLMIITLVLLIAVHVIGNALGIYLRDQSPLHRHQEPLPLHAQPLQNAPLQRSTEEPTHMQQRSYSGWWVIASLAIGFTAGASAVPGSSGVGTSSLGRVGSWERFQPR